MTEEKKKPSCHKEERSTPTTQIYNNSDNMIEIDDDTHMIISSDTGSAD